MSPATTQRPPATHQSEVPTQAQRKTTSPHNALSVSGDTRIALRDVDFETYLRLRESRAEPGVRLSFDGKDLEIMSPGYEHEDTRKLLGKLIEILLAELRISYVDLGSTRFTKTSAERGLEPDECYLLDPAKIEAFRTIRERGNSAEDAEEAGCPVPDLAVEIDFSSPQIDRPGIYSALQIREVWRLTRKELMIDRLQTDGSYQPSTSSEYLLIQANEVLRWVDDPGTWNRLDWLHRLQCWVREEIAPRWKGDPNASEVGTRTPHGTDTE